ncbi:MAG: GMC oxidoreductase, partial [Rhodoferax sp.]|uniref:GMC family oxidoreductase n=1 Tax=Rhodoferax sp. TaxID=50421 RepID=UPI00260F767C
GAWQELLLFGVVGNVACAHACISLQTRQFGIGEIPSAAQTPRSYGSVRLASKDPQDLPLVDPDFLASRDDMDRMVRGFKLTRHILAQPALAQFGGRELAATAQAQTDEEIEQVIRNLADTIYHPVGSCRMGPGEMDVVDAELRVHGLQGLRVVDASIMPRVVGGNTNAPVIMMAEKAADMIKAARQVP